MLNLAILSLDDYENWGNRQSLSLGGIAGVIKGILPYIKADKIYLMGITSNKESLYKEIPLGNNIVTVPIAYVSKDTKVPARVIAFWYSRKLNKILKKYHINSVYSHAEEMLYWVKPGPVILYHMHGSANAISVAKNMLFRNKLIIAMWEHLRTNNIKKATKIIAIDELCRGIAQKHNGHLKATLLPNFVDRKIFYKDGSKKSKLISHINERILMFAGRLEQVKGLELLVDTVVEINKISSEKWKGVFVGRGTYVPVVKKHIEEKGATDQIYFPGPEFDQEELRKIYNQASVFMVPSYFEGIPMAVLECLASGTPVISTNVGGIKNLVADGKMCFVHDERDPVAFAQLALATIGKNNTTTEAFNYNFSAARAGDLVNSIFAGIKQ
jgi:glycosyltransferase involved in cell wall biosynthesis